MTTRLQEIEGRLTAYQAVRYHRDELIELNLTPDAYEFFDHVPDDFRYLLALAKAGKEVVKAVRKRIEWSRLIPIETGGVTETCPECGISAVAGHGSDCEFGKALAAYNRVAQEGSGDA